MIYARSRIEIMHACRSSLALLLLLTRAAEASEAKGATTQSVQISSTAPSRPESKQRHPLPVQESSLDVPIDRFEELQAGQAFAMLCRKFLNWPCGLEEEFRIGISGGANGRPMQFSNTSARQVLDEVVKRNPKYRWIIRNGVLNLEPKVPVGKDVLSTTLASFSTKNVSTFKAALDALHQADIVYSYQGKGGRFARVDLTLSNVTVREALNAIVKADGQAIWILSHRLNSKGVPVATFMMGSGRTSGGQFFSNEEKRAEKNKHRPDRKRR